MKEVINSIPEKTGVYFFKNRDDEIIYIGKSICLKKRITDHFRDGSNKIFIKVERENVNPKNRMPMDTWDYTAKYLEKIPSLVFNKERKKKNQIKGSTEKIDYIVTDSEEEALTLEGCLISAIRPPLNRMMWKYPFIEITLGEAIPRVLTAYQILDPNSYIYGPFNIAADIDLAIDGFLMVIPICNHENPIKMNQRHLPNCIKHQIKRCLAPCKNSELLDNYQDYVKEFITELEKSGEGVINKLVVLMNEETSSENFEGAAIIRDCIQAIKLLFTQKAIPVVLEKYHTEVKRIIGQKTNYLEIIEKILANNTNGR